MDDEVAIGIEYLRSNDLILRQIIDSSDPFKIKTSSDFFKDLVKSIISQQLSVKAANSIYNRLESNAVGISPQSILDLDKNQLRQLGLSFQKAGFLHGLSERFIKNPIVRESFSDLSDDQAIELLCEINGVGVWTAQMFLIFSLNRLNILPLGDVGFIRSVQKNYGFNRDDKLNQKVVHLAKKWGQYKSIAVWYLWQDIDNS